MENDKPPANEKQVGKLMERIEGFIGGDENDPGDTKFDRRLRAISGIITVLGVAATTCMKLMQTEKAIRDRKAEAEKAAARKVPKKKPVKKQPPRRMMARLPEPEKVIDQALRIIKKRSDKTLKMARAWEKEVKKRHGH